MAKENIDIINMKCHDLKHQISALKRIESSEARNQAIGEIEHVVNIYNCLAKTGNSALDLILTEKSLLCEKYKISFTSAVNGEKLNFISDTDMYSLFGNALDNAIENLITEEEQNRRLELRVYAEEDMLFVRIENYCSKLLVFADGFPVTTHKENVEYHGFGMRSMEYIVSKYGGELFVKLKNDTFYLDIFFGNQQKGAVGTT